MIKGQQQQKAFEEKIQYTFKDANLLNLALRHSSFTNETRKELYESNERLEFFGDAVLDMVVSEYMYREFPQMLEGGLTKLRAAVVCEGSLSRIARKIDLGDYVLLGKGEETTGGRTRDSILADTFEAVVGAIAMDGGVVAAQKFIMEFMEEAIQSTKHTFLDLDCKTHLQELMQKTSKIPIQYEIVAENGPDHNKVFVAEVRHGKKTLGKGEGKSKKEAEQSAAHNALELLEG
ncbi:MAG: ribonuclease III [Bacillota bacterium]